MFFKNKKVKILTKIVLLTTMLFMEKQNFENPL
jgi:hypothetical protein